MRPLRIVHAVRSGSFAGVEQFVRRLALAQRAAGHEVTVIGGAASEMRDPLRAGGVAYEPGVRTVDVARVVHRHAREADVVNAHMTAADGAAAVALVGMRHRPALVSTRHFALRRGSHGPAFVYRMVGARIDAEIAISRAVAEAIGRPSTVVHTGVADAPESTLERARVVLVAQRLQPEKRTDIAVRAFAASGLAGEGWELLIAGDGVERAPLRALATSLGVDEAVTQLGFRADVPDLMARAGMLVAPCPVEGLGLTVLEAMASGLPVIAADAAGHRELLDGVDPGSRFAANNVDAAASALRRFAHDEAAREALGAAGRGRQRAEFSVDGQVSGTDAVYRAALARWGRA